MFADAGVVTVRSLLAAAVVTLLWLGLALAPFTRGWSDRRWAVAIVAGLVAAYVGQALSMTMFYNGGQGDDRYQLALVDVLSQGRIFSDYYYHGVQAHYPPLAFWPGAAIEAIFGGSAVAALRWMPVFAIVAAALLVAWAAGRARSSPSLSLILTFGMGSFLVSYLTSFGPTRGLWALVILKPQQVLGGAMAVAFPALIASGARSRQRRVTDLTGTALVAGMVLTMPLYVPLAIGAGAVVIWRRHRSGSTSSRKRPDWGSYALMLGAGCILTAFYWLPLLFAVGSGNWHNNYVYWQSIDSLDPSRWSIGFAFGVPLVAGILAIRRYHDAVTWGLASVTVFAGVLYASAFVTYPLLGISLLAWWAPIPAVMALAILAARYLRDWLELRFEAGPLHISLRKARLPVIMLIATALLPFANWNTFTDPQLERAHDAIDEDLLAGSRILRDQLGRDESFIAGTEGLLLAGMSGRSLTVVPHAFYANPMGRTAERRSDIEAFFRDPDCAQSRELSERWGLRAIAAEVIPVAGGAPAGAAAADPAASGSSVSSQSLGISFLDPERGFSPEKAGKTVYVPLSAAINTLPCWKKALEGSTMTIYLSDFAVAPAD